MRQRTEYPRPQFQREDWLSLNGEWEFAFDDEGEGLAKGYDTGRVPLPLKINVPFSYQYPASGIGDPSVHPCVWYRRTFEAKGNRHALLSFNGADYKTDVWVNDKHAASHEGGYTPFTADITRLLRQGTNTIVVRCFDPLDPVLPRGKQSWTGDRFACWYIPNTGLWQSVWIDWVGEDAILSHTLFPDLDTFSVSGEIVTAGVADEAEICVSFRGEEIKKVRFSLDGRHTRYSFKLKEPNSVDPDYTWRPGHPVLFGAKFRLFKGGKPVDAAASRFGFRKIKTDGNTVVLNSEPLYERLILDQGYWEESGITPPSTEAIKKDILLAMSMGFNGARKHQKFEDPYFYYYADELGFLTWCEMPSAYEFCAEEEGRIASEWAAIVREASVFASVIAYVPLNESWGARNIASDGAQQNFARSLYYATKALDPTRLVSTNDGWESPDATDLLGLHDYAFDSSAFAEKYRADRYDGFYRKGRRMMAEGCAYRGQPVLLTEFGGIAMTAETKDGNWGYNDGAKDEEAFFARYGELIRGIYAHPELRGFCYTQLTDVQQEVNGLLYPDRTPKFDCERLKRITEGKE